MVQMQPHGDLHLVFMNVLGVEKTRQRGKCRVESIMLEAVPPKRAQSIRSRVVKLSRQAQDEGEVYRPVVRLALGEDAKVGDVLNSLECYVVDMFMEKPPMRAVCVTGIGSE